LQKNDVVTACKDGAVAMAMVWFFPAFGYKLRFGLKSFFLEHPAEGGPGDG
jgi:hypothetical protein